MADGELRFETKLVGTPKRASLFVVMRSAIAGSQLLGYAIMLGQGSVANIFAHEDGGSRLLGLGPLGTVAWTEWTTVAIRAQGDGLWLIVNDVPVVHASDAAHADGAVTLGLQRSGDVNDDTEVTAVFRNMRISALEGGDPARAPRYQAPSRPAAPSSSTSSDEPPPLPAKPPECNSIKWERARNGQWVLWCDQTDWNQ